MSLFERAREFLGTRSPGPVNEWFVVTFDDTVVRLQVNAPGRSPWSDKFTWDSVVRVCFKAEGIRLSDGIYVNTTERAEGYVIPTEATGGGELWSEILRRELFDADLAIEAAGSARGLFCWPPEGPAL